MRHESHTAPSKLRSLRGCVARTRLFGVAVLQRQSISAHRTASKVHILHLCSWQRNMDVYFMSASLRAGALTWLSRTLAKPSRRHSKHGRRGHRGPRTASGDLNTPSISTPFPHPGKCFLKSMRRQNQALRGASTRWRCTQVLVARGLRRSAPRGARLRAGGVPTFSWTLWSRTL